MGFKKIREEKIKDQEREGTIIEKDKVESEKNTDQQLQDYCEKNHIKKEYATQEFPMENKIQCLNLSENNLENLNRQKRLQEAKRIAEEEMKRHLERVEARRKRRADEEYLINEEFKKIREEKIKDQEREGTIIEKDILIEEDENKVQNETEMILEQKKDKVERLRKKTGSR